MSTKWIMAALAVILLPALGRAEVISGPEVGSKVAGLKVFGVTGAQENKAVDYAAERKDKPTIYAFVSSDKWVRPMARFLKELDKTAKTDSDAAYVVAVWLTDDKDATKEYLPKAQMSLQFENTALSYFEGEKAGPKDWSINGDAHITVVVTHKGKVAARFGYMTINEKDVEAVLGALKKALK